MNVIDKKRINYDRTLEELQETVWKLSRQILQMTTEAGSGHPSSSLSAIDVLTAIFFGGFMRYDPERPNWPGRDRFILSKGHAAPALYAVLAEAGFFNPDKLNTLREIGSPLEGHPNMRVLPGVEASTGSLGQGLSIGLGHALATKLNDQQYRVYVLIGDGEVDEGQIWEAAMSAAKYQADNLTAILDHNQFQQTGAVSDVMPSLKPIGAKWEAFGWHVREINGHDMKQVLAALKDVRRITQRPQLIIAHTRKGRGLSPFESDNVNRKHGVPLDEDQLKVALAELDEQEAMFAPIDAVEDSELTAEDVYGEV
jgi:transketolase